MFQIAYNKHFVSIIELGLLACKNNTALKTDNI
jgi:hypothetical protein